MLTLLLACGNPSLSTGETGGADDTGPSNGDDSGEAPAEALVINELMASNSSGVTDEGGAYPDWLELYNGTDTEIDLEGYTLSDDPKTPDKHVLPALSLESGGFLLLYADDDVKEGELHLGFKLQRAGEDVLLSDPDGAAVDHLSYGEQVTDVSYARVTDGASSWDFAAEPTPGASNG